MTSGNRQRKHTQKKLQRKKNQQNTRKEMKTSGKSQQQKDLTAV